MTNVKAMFPGRLPLATDREPGRCGRYCLSSYAQEHTQQDGEIGRNHPVRAAADIEAVVNL
jgi:hypothetical protein